MPVLTGTQARSLIVNGDDLGLSPGINRGIFEAHREGILTSASLMATGDAFDEAVRFAKEDSSLSLGVHLTLVEGTPVLPPEKIPSLVTADGRFVDSLHAFVLKWFARRIRVVEIQKEFEAQVEKVVACGIRVQKLDSHMHLHLIPGLLDTCVAAAKRFGIKGIRLPNENLIGQSYDAGIAGVVRRALLTSLSLLYARRITAAGMLHPDHFRGVAESGRLTEIGLLRILGGLRPGVTELMVHPGYRDQVLDRWPKSRRYRREEELKALTSPHIRSVVTDLGIRLVGYEEVWHD